MQTENVKSRGEKIPTQKHLPRGLTSTHQDPSEPSYSHKDASPWQSTDFIWVRKVHDSKESIVYVVNEKESQGPHAVKVISKASVIRNHNCRQIIRELGVIRSLRHSHCVRYFAWFHDRNSIYHVMEKAEMSVADLLKNHYQKGMPERTVSKMMIHASRGLEYLHHMGIVHRDMKPSNLLLFKQGDSFVVKISDFGSSVQTRYDDLRKSARGTTPYMAPELVRGTGYSFPVDVWSLGVTAHELYSTELPFDGSHPMEIFRKIVRSDYHPPPACSSYLRGILTLCLQKQPENRPSVTELLPKLLNSFS